MKKEIKGFGTGLGIYFCQEECRVHDLHKGDIVDLSDMTKVKNGKKNKEE